MVSTFATQRIVVAACPVTVIANPPFVVSAVRDTAQVAAPTSCDTKFAVIPVPTSDVAAAFAPRLIVPINCQDEVLPPPVTPATIVPRTL